MAAYHREDIQKYFFDVFGFDGDISDSVEYMVKLFEDIGVPMYFEDKVSKEDVRRIETGSCLSPDEICEILCDCL